MPSCYRSLGQGNVFRSICLSMTGSLYDVPSCQGGLCPGGSMSGEALLQWLGALSRESLSGGGGLCPGGLCSGGSLPGTLSRVGGSQSGEGALSRESLSRGSLSKEVSVQGWGSLSRGGGLCPGGSNSKSTDPPPVQ